MFDFHEKRKLRGIVYSKVTALLILIVAILISVSAYERYSIARETAEKRDEMKHQLETLNGKAALLETKVERLESERGIENEIREQFDVAKGNEQVVVIVDEEAPSTTETPVIPLPQERTLFDRLKFW